VAFEQKIFKYAPLIAKIEGRDVGEIRKKNG
jgi:hypothetical protein